MTQNAIPKKTKAKTTQKHDISFAPKNQKLMTQRNKAQNPHNLCCSTMQSIINLDLVLLLTCYFHFIKQFFSLSLSLSFFFLGASFFSCIICNFKDLLCVVVEFEMEDKGSRKEAGIFQTWRRTRQQHNATNYYYIVVVS